jgi:hypothetical protein
MGDAKIAAGVALKFLGKLTYLEKCPVRLAFAYRFLGTVPCQNFRYAAMTDGGRLYEFQLSTNMRQQQFDF